MDTFKKIHTFEISLMGDMVIMKYSIGKISLFSIFTSGGIYNNSRREALI